MLRCLNPNEAGYVLAEIHGGANGQHMGAKALARKTLRAGYYWPTLEADSKTLVRQWPFKASTRQLRLIVAIDYFTKWIEAEPLTTISSARVQRSNGQGEAANKVILDGLKKRMMSWRGKSILSQGEIANSEALAIELDRPMRPGLLPLSGYCNEAVIAARYNKKVRPRRFRPVAWYLEGPTSGTRTPKTASLPLIGTDLIAFGKLLRESLHYGKFGWNPYQANMECGQIKGIFRLGLSVVFLKASFSIMFFIQRWLCWLFPSQQLLCQI
ncbi:hypothetical protein K1719_021695 [Acacia pycnantha]|nr:hypothetical protein K1719_021695 [Acacia pycnantha]